MPVNPDQVTDVDSWIQYFVAKEKNLKLGADGSLLVFDPANTEAAPKVIPKGTGYDAYAVLQSSGGLRDAASALLAEKSARIEESAAVALGEYSRVERDYLAAVDAWKAAPSVLGALEVARLSKTLNEADAAYRTALFPKRRVVNYHSGTERFSVEDRTFKEGPIGATAADTA
jgi:hypothetical protein